LFLARRPKPFIGSTNSGKSDNDYDSYGESIRQRVFRELDKNSILTPSQLCGILQIDRKHWNQIIANYKTDWRHNHKNERGSKCSLHGWRGWCYLPSEVGVATLSGALRTRAVDVGWIVSRARNRWLLWKDRIGRLQWFETGRVNLYVRKPANLGKAYQLICNAFSFTGLITDMKVLEEILGGLRFKGAHYVFPVGQRLPKLTIDLFQKSNGIVIKVGDNTHPDSLEVLATYPDWAERNERILEQVNEVLKRLFEPSGNLQSKRGDVNYVT
jgi:hypothetical protein